MNRDFWDMLLHTVRDLVGHDPSAKTQTDFYKRYASASSKSQSDQLRTRLASYGEPSMPEHRGFDEAINEAAGIEVPVRVDTKGTTYFTTPELLADTVKRLQITRMAAVAKSRMSAFTYKKLKPRGVVGHACVFDDFVAPFLIQLSFNDGSTCFLQVSGVSG